MKYLDIHFLLSLVVMYIVAPLAKTKELFTRIEKMIKTSEELTEDWKAGKLDWNKFYYIKLTSGEICIDYAHGAYFIKGKPQEITMDYTTDNDVKQILAPVPDYEEFESLRKTANGVKYVSDKCWEKTKALEGNVTMFKSLFRQYLEREKEIENLRALLKECKEYLSDVDTYFNKNADEAALLLTKIDEVLE